MVECMVWVHEVAGSIPVIPTVTLIIRYNILMLQLIKNVTTQHGVIAQLGEHLPCKQRVRGSTPLNSIT